MDLTWLAHRLCALFLLYGVVKDSSALRQHQEAMAGPSGPKAKDKGRLTGADVENVNVRRATLANLLVPALILVSAPISLLYRYRLVDPSKLTHLPLLNRQLLPLGLIVNTCVCYRQRHWIISSLYRTQSSFWTGRVPDWVRQVGADQFKLGVEL